MEQYQGLIKLFFQDADADIKVAHDALFVAWACCGRDVELALDTVEDLLGPGAKAKALLSAEMMPPPHMILPTAVEVFRSYLEQDPDLYDVVDKIMLKHIAPEHRLAVFTEMNPAQAHLRGGYYKGGGLQSAVDLTRDALSACEDGIVVEPIIIGSTIYWYDPSDRVWQPLETGRGKPPEDFRALFAGLVERGLVCAREKTKIKGAGGKDVEVYAWEVACCTKTKWSNIVFGKLSWAELVARFSSLDGEGAVRDGLHLKDKTIRLKQDARGEWAICSEVRTAEHNAFFCLPFTEKDVQDQTDAPLFEALLDNLTAGYQELGWALEVKTAIKRWLGLALLGAGGLNIKAPLLAITGATGGGKSTLLLTLKELLGKHAVSSQSMRNLLLAKRESQSFRENLLGKIINIDTELTNSFLESPEEFKQLLSGEPVSMWTMGKRTYSAPVSCMFITAGQSTPRFRDVDTAILRRVINVHVDPRAAEDYRKHKPIADYHKRLAREEGPAIVATCLKALTDGVALGLPLTQVADPLAPWIKAQHSAIRAESNTAVAFWQEAMIEYGRPADIKRNSLNLSQAYACYLQWCNDTRGGTKSAQSNQQFRRSLEDAGAWVWRDGRNVYFPGVKVERSIAARAGILQDVKDLTWVDDGSCPEVDEDFIL